MKVAYEAAKRVLPAYSHRFSRKDFTLSQLFACLVMREHQKKNYRGIEALLKDTDWCQRLGMKKVPDHNTLFRAFSVIVRGRHIKRLMDLLTQWMEHISGRTLAIDSSLYDTHHRSRHYEQRCRHMSSKDRKNANFRRSRSAKRTPKLAIGVDTRTHVIHSCKVRTGMGSDCRDFSPLIQDAMRRRRFRVVLADAGYDSELNHEEVRETYRARSLIKMGAGRPTNKKPSGRYRRLMQTQLAGSQKGKPYGQRAQVETTNSMLKRNLGDSLRCRSAARRQKEQLLRVVVHNIMIALVDSFEGSRQSRCVPVSFSKSFTRS